MAGNNSSLKRCKNNQKWHLDQITDYLDELEKSQKNDSKREQASTNSQGEADPDNVESVMDAVGEIVFCGQHKCARYVRLGKRISPNEPSVARSIWNVFEKHWKLPLPKLLISVTGGAKFFRLKPRLKTILNQGLLTSAVKSGAWIITGGTATGVMALVGEAVQDYLISMGSRRKQRLSDFVTLGVATWGAVIGCLKELKKDKKSIMYAHDENDETEMALDENDKTKMALDHNHTHFVLVDDGTQNEFGGEIKIRSALESYFVNIIGESEQNRTCVLVVIEGGRNTVKTVCETAKKEIPVVIIDGSGEAADLIAYAYRSATTEDFQNSFKERADKTTKLKKMNSKLRDKLRDVIIEKRHLMYIFDFNGGDSVKDLTKMILKASFEGMWRNREGTGTIIHKLRLAMSWDCYDIVEESIYNSAIHKDEKNYGYLYHEALLNNQAEFVELFIDRGLDLKKFLTRESLCELYRTCLQPPHPTKETELLFDLILYTKNAWWKRWYCFDPSEKNKNCSELWSIGTIGTVVVYLLDDTKFNFYLDNDNEGIQNSKDGENPKDDCKKNLDNAKNGGQNIKGHKANGTGHESISFNCPERELLLWAVLLNRDRLINLFWRKGRDHMGGALFIAALSKSLSKFAEKNDSFRLADSFANRARKYEELATNLLTQCASNDDQERAHQLLVRKLPHWVGDKNGSCTSVLTLAESYRMMDFTLEPTTKTKLNTLWRGTMSPLTSRLLIFFTIFLPLLLFFIKFTDVPVQRFCCFRCSNKVDESEQSSNTSNKMNTFKTVHLFSCSEKKICFVSALRLFHLAPITIFICEYISYGVFLCLFSYFVLVELGPPSEPNVPSASEIIMWIWVGTLVLEEIRQFTGTDKKFWRHKVMTWWDSSWNQFDLIMYTMVVVSIILRFTLTDNFVWARIMYSLTLGVFFLRLLYYFYANSDVGPKVVMIRQMLTDLKIFILLLIVFVLSFGVMYHANMFPQSPRSWNILANVFYFPYFQIYGELFLDQVKGEDSGGCTRNESIWRENPKLRCPEENVLVPTLTAVYLLLTMILLVNLLIAMLNFTFSELHKDSAKIWNYNMLSLIYEYSDRPSLAPPLIFFTHIYRLFDNFCQWMSVDGKTRCSFFKYLCSKKETPFNMDISKQEDTILTMYERICMEKIHLDTPISTTNNGSNTKTSSSEIRQPRKEQDDSKGSKKVSEKQRQTETYDDNTRMNTDNLANQKLLVERKHSSKRKTRDTLLAVAETAVEDSFS